MIQDLFTLRGHNPDVLTCIANLSNDEVFTPPEVASAMLDLLATAWADANDGADIWADPNVTFLDPVTKSGVFLREITRRLTEGLALTIPDLTERVNHILTRQVYGIGITQLTALLARRSVYCSRYANSPHSIVKSFTTEAGNIWFERTEHTWMGGTRKFHLDPLTGDEIPVYIRRKCRYCGANEDDYARGNEFETHAYAFTHTDDIKARIDELFGETMHFDVIIGNPPYQLNDGGGTGSSAAPIYRDFVEQAKTLDPRFLVMIIPSKWFSGGKGLDGFRQSMLNDQRVRFLADYPDSRDVFNGVDVSGGVCYFLWNRDHPGTCHVETISSGERTSVDRVLNEYSVFVRDNRALKIIKKIETVENPTFSSLVSARRPFGIDSSHERDGVGDLYLYAAGRDGRIDRSNVPKGEALIDRWKVLLSKTSSEHAGQTDKDGMRRVFSRIETMSPETVATESYLIVGPFGDELESQNVAEYLRTRFVRFLVSSVLSGQNITRSSFSFVPRQDFSRQWSDADLYTKYGLDSEDISFIESTIKPLKGSDE